MEVKLCHVSWIFVIQIFCSFVRDFQKSGYTGTTWPKSKLTVWEKVIWLHVNHEFVSDIFSISLEHTDITAELHVHSASLEMPFLIFFSKFR